MARKIVAHQSNACNEQLTITSDDPGHGGASHSYLISGFNTYGNKAAILFEDLPVPAAYLPILFQNGPIAEVGVNGVTHEALLSILIDRLQGFQSGPYACRENAIALTKLQEALMWLNSRTSARVARGVEGTSEV